MKSQLQLMDGANPAAGRGVGPIAGLLNGLFSKATVRMNQVEVYSTTDFNYITHMTTALMLPDAEHQRMDACEGYYLDENAINDVQLNQGFNLRTQIYDSGKNVEMLGGYT